ncbi:MAG: hypothetical protein PHY47_09995 [Lachnospiraceae bacterium]|nr:hypothetical protein [Lachnospiraceae bacterium]
MLAFSNNNYELDFGAKQSVELFCAYDANAMDISKLLSKSQDLARSTVKEDK